ncbi:MAG: 3'-5' exoribonuclease YhaM family protein [Candidatus Krumholzibacteriia bacterium]
MDKHGTQHDVEAAPKHESPRPLRVADLCPGMRPDGVVVVKKKVRREQPDGGRFLLFQLADRSGQINAVLWHGADIVDGQIDAGDLARVQGEVQLYQKSRQIKLVRMERADPSCYDLSEFLPTSENDLDALYERLLSVVDGVRNAYLRRLYGDIFRDPTMHSSYKCSPAGKGWHHAYVGGLLEHVLAMLDLGEVLVQHHPGLDRDLMIGGILLHDIGKIEELMFKSYIAYTNRGRLIGHLVQGCILVSRYMDRIDGFPAELRTRLLHTIVSHHGSVDRGSPKPPMTLEATVVHLLDHLDSQAHAVEQVVRGTNSDDGWSEHVKLVDRYFYRGSAERAGDADGSG